MAELYAKPFETIDTGYNPQQPQGGGQSSEVDEYLSSLPPEERQAAIQRLNAPLTGEELATLAGSGQKMPTVAEFAEIEKFHKNHEISFIDGLGKIAEGGEQFMTDISKAFGAMIDNPKDVASKMPATAVEAFAQGTRNFYGMLAQSNNTDSTLFKVKDFLNGTGTIEDRYNQYIQALKFNKDSMELAEGKQRMVMDADMINHEVTQAMAYIADPTLFIPFTKVASTGLRAVGLGEKLAMAGARSAAIKNGIIGNTIKWGVGQPLEFMGGAVRNTIDFGLEKAGAAFEATTGVGAKEFAQTARMSGIGFSASAVAGHAVPFASTISDAYIVGSSARGFGEALTLVGETMKNNPFGRGVRSWAAESLKQAEKNGVALSPHAKGLLRTLDAVDPLFAYGYNAVETAAEGAYIGGGLGYLSGGEEGMYSGIGAGIAMGAVGGTAGKVVADVTGGTNVARRAIQAKMTIEGHKVLKPEKAMFFQAMQTAAEARGKDVDLVNSVIIGIDEVAPNFEFHALTPEQFENEAKQKGYDPTTGKFKEVSALDSEFGGDRASKSKAVSILRSVGGDFVGNRQGFLDALKKASAKDSANPNKPASNIPLNLKKYTDVAKTFDKLTKTQQEAVLKEIDGQGAIAKELGGNTRLRDHYDTLTWAEGWTDQLVKKFESDREGSRKDITEMLAQETGKDGKLNRKGRALADKLRAEGFLDRDNKLLRERNLLQADLTLSQFEHSKGALIARESDGKSHMYINLTRMGDETFPHELFHTIMRESPMKKHFTDSLVTKLLGTVDKDGNLVRPAEVNIGQVTKFFKKYIDLANRNPDGTLDVGTADSIFTKVQEALTEYQNAGANKKISDKARGLLENYSEEFGAYYFSHWLMGRNRNTLFFGGELKGIEGLVERTKDSFKDFWQSKISKANPEFDFSQGLNASFDRSKGLGRIGAIDYYMRDMVRAASNANREAFRPDSMTLDNLRDFERSNGLRNLTTVDGNRRLNPREQVTQNIRLGKEAFKILSGVDRAMRTSKDVIDENGKQVITGRLSETELDALVKGGIVPRAWADKVNQGYAMLDGTISNVFSAGYLGKTEQTTDASYPRLTGRDVAFKNRKAVLFDVETKVKADGTFYTLFHTLDLAVIEQEANRLFQNTDYRALFDGDRAVMEADFFRYLSNASRASTDPKKLDSAALLEKGDGLGAQRRDVLHQMGRMALQTGDAYKHQPIAVIPEGFRHSVTTFNIDGMTMPRVETGTRVDINMGNAHKFIRENWQPDEMKQEKTPTGVVMTHETGFKFTKDASGRVSAYTDDGSKVGTFGSIKEATTASKNLYNKAQDNIRKIAQVAKQKEVESRKNLQPLDEAFYEEAFSIGDMFKTKRMQKIVGNSRLVRQTFDEFLGQKVEEINSGKNEQEKGAILAKLFNSEFKELIDLEAELRKTYDEFGLEASQLQAQETEITKRIVEFSQEKQRLQESGNPDAKVDIPIIEMYGRIYKRKEEVNKRLSEIANKMHNEGINDLNSHYYITKRFLEKFNETGKLSEEAISFAMKPSLIKAYEANFETGKAVTFLANHGTPNHELIVSKTFNTEFLGRNTGSLSAFNATFFAGSKETSLAFVGVPLAKTWVRDFIQARPYYVKKFSPELVAKLESMLSSDTSKGVVQKVKYLMKNAHIEFPDDFKLKDTGRKTKEGEPYIAPRPESQKGYDIDGFLDRMLESANDEGAVFGGVETYWEEAGRKPYLLRNIVKMDNPYVHEYAKADYRDETFASVIQRAKDAGHDGVIFKNTRDGGGLDTIFASFAKNEDNKIFTLETTEDTRFVPRGNDEAGNKIKNGSEIEGRNYQPDEIPEKKGTTKIKEGYTRVYHQTTADNIESIKRSGLLVSKSRPSSESRGVSVSETPFYGDNPELVTIELQVPTDKLRQANGSSLLEDVPAGNIIAVHEPWHDKVRYIENNSASLKEVLNGDMDFFLGDGSPEAKAIEYIKNKHNKKSAKLQPTDEAEGGRVYDFNSPKFKSSFIGKWAEENPERLQNKNIEFVKRRDGSYRITMTDNSGATKKIGHITADLDMSVKGEGIAVISSNIDKKFRGNKLANVLYSEMAERLRAMGVKYVDGTIVNPEGIPVQVRNTVIGQTYYKGSNKPAFREDAAKKIQAVQSIYPSKGIDVYNELDFNARYQPAEGEQGGRTYTPEQMQREFVGRYASENPNVTKGLKINHGVIIGRMGQEAVVLMKDGEMIGRLTWMTDKKNGNTYDLAVEIEPEHQGKKYQHLLYSEAYERMRAKGFSDTYQEIYNEQGVPIKSQIKILGKDAGTFTNRKFKQQKLTYDAFMRDMKYALKNGDESVSTEAKLDPRAWYQPTEDWSTQRAIKARENQPRELWTYPNTENFKKWAGKLKFIDNEESANKGVNYDKGFVTTVFKGVSVRSFDKFSERSKVELGERPVNTDPNFFIADETAAERYAGGGYFDVNSLNEDAQKAASRGKADMYYIKSNKPANLLNAHKLEASNPRLYEVINRFWENNIKEDGHSVLDPRTKVDRFLLEIAMGDWLSPRNEMTTISPFGQPWRMDNWVKFHEHLLKNGYDSVVIHDNSVSKKAPTIVVPQETAKVKGSSNYGEFSRKNTRYNFQPDEGRKYNKGQMDNQFIGRQAAERRDLTDGIRLAYRGWDKQDGKDEGRKSIKLIRTADGNEIGRIDFDYDHLTNHGIKSRGFGNGDKGGIVINGINVRVHDAFQGMGYQHILYSEMFERARAIGAVGFSQSIENKKGLPLKSVNRVIGEADNFIASLAEPDPQRPTQENFDRLMAGAPSPTGNWVSNEPAVQNWGKLDKKAWYMPDENPKSYVPKTERAKELFEIIKSVPHYKEAFESGQLTIDAYKTEDFKEFHILSHAPDTASTVDGKYFKGQGGIGYPLLFKGEGWAAVSRGLEKRINAIGEKNRAKNNGEFLAPVALVMSHAEKIKSAINGTNAFVNVIKALNDKKVITDEVLRLALIKGLKNAGVNYITDSNLLADALWRTKTKFLKLEGSGFKARAKFVKDVAGAIAKESENLTPKQMKILKEIIPDYEGSNRLTSKHLVPSIFSMFEDPMLKGVDAPDKKTGGTVYGFVLFDKPLVESKESPHGSYKYSVKHEDNSPVRVDILSNPVHTMNMFSKAVTKKGEVPLEMKTVVNKTGQRNFPYGDVKHHMPAEYTEFKSEQSATGRILRNAKGYVIMLANNKFRVYNPAKAIIGVYGNEEEAKKRIYKEIPKR